MTEPASTNISSGIGFEIDPCDLGSRDHDVPGAT